MNDYEGLPPDQDDYTPEQLVEEPEPKRARVMKENWIEALEAEAPMEIQFSQIMDALEETDEALMMSVELDLSSNRQRKFFARNPVAFLVKKLNNAEVQLKNLSADDRLLFDRAKTKEVSSFIKNSAVQRCLDNKEVQKAYSTGRIIKARWVLTWKEVPPDEQQEALHDRHNNPVTVINKDGKKKAKARIVLLGFQHPNLLDRQFKTAAPVQSNIGRNMLYLLSAQHQWALEGLDLATAFLQTNSTEADAELYTPGVPELRQALGVDDSQVLKVLRNIYGSTTAPRGLWLDLHKRLQSIGGKPSMTERCLWLWYSEHEKDELNNPRFLGAMGGHVDDFHRLGDRSSPEWCEVCNKIDKLYQWGTVKRGNYRHAGCDVITKTKANGTFSIHISQQAYVESLMDLEIDPDRLRENGALTNQEIGACRTSLGALQWLGIQTQPQIMARCNLLLSEVIRGGQLSHAREIQQIICELRSQAYELKFFRIETAERWNDLVFISMGDQAHTNRPKGDSTGGIVSLVAGPESLQGIVSPMMLMAWRTWKLKRVSLSSTDAEVQSMVEAEDQNFRMRLLWVEMHSSGSYSPLERLDLVEKAEAAAKKVHGVLCTDSRGGFDAVELNESPLLGLSNLRSALQVFQLRNYLRRTGGELRWLASDYDLADALTKKKAECRIGLEKFLKAWKWMIAFDPSFTSAKRNKQQGKTAVLEIERQQKELQTLFPWEQFESPDRHFLSSLATSSMSENPFYGDATDVISHVSDMHEAAFLAGSLWAQFQTYRGPFSHYPAI